MSLSNTAPVTGTAVSISATVVNHRGAVVPGIECTFAVISQTGTGATVEAGPKITDANGVATTTLSTGTAAGTIVVGADCGELSSQVSVQTTAAPPVVVPAVPPAAAPAGATTISMPRTGTGPEEIAPIGLFLTVLLVGGLACLAAGETLRIVSKRARNS
jgi:hypothetical protein